MEKNLDGGREKNGVRQDVEILKKQMVKNLVKKSSQWEAIALTFKRKYKTKNMIKEQGEKKLDDMICQSFFFLKNKKLVDMNWC